MNYNHLLYFSVLAQTEHYTTAAARLGISQPALSSAIHQLENSLGGVKLFEKVGRNIRLTDEGRFYQETVDEAMKRLHGASMLLRQSKTQAPVIIRMGVVSGTLDGLLARQIVNYTENNQRIRFDLTESSSENLMNLVRTEKLDMAIVDTSNRDRSLHFRKLCQRNLFAAIPQNHPLAKGDSVAPQEIATAPQVVFNDGIESSFGLWASGVSSDEHILCTVNTSGSALDLVAAGVGISILSEDCVIPREGVTFLPVQNWHRALYMCILYDKWLEPPVWEFVERLVRIIRSLPEKA